MRSVFAALLLCPFVPANVAAQPVANRTDSFESVGRVAQAEPAVRRSNAVRYYYRANRRPHVQPRRRAPGHVVPMTLARGFRGELALAAGLPPNLGSTRRKSSTGLAGVVPTLATKAREIQSACGSRVVSSIRYTRIRGTGGRLSLHASGRAVDMAGSPACIYSHLLGWPGGYSTDYGRVRHVHISYAPHGPEWGVRFRHYRGGHRHKRHARRGR